MHIILSKIKTSMEGGARKEAEHINIPLPPKSGLEQNPQLTAIILGTDDKAALRNPKVPSPFAPEHYSEEHPDTMILQRGLLTPPMSPFSPPSAPAKQQQHQGTSIDTTSSPGFCSLSLSLSLFCCCCSFMKKTSQENLLTAEQGLVNVHTITTVHLPYVVPDMNLEVLMINPETGKSHINRKKH